MKMQGIEFMILTSSTVLWVYFVDLSRLKHIERSQFSSDFSRQGYQCPREQLQQPQVKYGVEAECIVEREFEEYV